MSNLRLRRVQSIYTGDSLIREALIQKQAHPVKLKYDQEKFFYDVLEIEVSIYSLSRGAAFSFFTSFLLPLPSCLITMLGNRSEGDGLPRSTLPACRLSACNAQAGVTLGAGREEALLFFQDLDLGETLSPEAELRATWPALFKISG